MKKYALYAYVGETQTPKGTLLFPVVSEAVPESSFIASVVADNEAQATDWFIEKRLIRRVSKITQIKIKASRNRSFIVECDLRFNERVLGIVPLGIVRGEK
ncbi:MAG: hypothetical protein IKW14_04135 [Phascolarctobacterium sp.]|nr:hypothetical protein [Phascolarctobacterium sp.]